MDCFVAILGHTALDKLCASVNRACVFVSLGDSWLRYVLVLKLNRITEPFAPRIFYMAIVHLSVNKYHHRLNDMPTSLADCFSHVSVLCIPSVRVAFYCNRTVRTYSTHTLTLTGLHWPGKAD